MTLDEQLSQPLPEIPDGNFSRGVMGEVARQEIRRARIEAAGWIALAIGLMGIFALTQPGRQLAAIALSLGFFAQLCVGLMLVLVLFPPTVAQD
jgi:hypothetical protein